MTRNLSLLQDCPDLLAKLGFRDIDPFSTADTGQPPRYVKYHDRMSSDYRHLSEATDSDYYEAWGRLAEECGKQDIWIEPDNDGEELRWWICGPRAADFDSPFTDPLLALHAAYAATKGK